MTSEACATVVVVAYKVTSLDLGWVPSLAPVVVVHNDRSLDRAAVRHEAIHHVDNERNVGFGAAVNVALPLIRTERLIVANPDMRLTPDHWRALSVGGDDEVRTVPIVTPDGRPTSTVNRYPTPASLLLTTYRVGRLAPRDSTLRRASSRLLGSWGREHNLLMSTTAGTWPLSEFWVSGALFSVTTARFRAVGGFDSRYFLYFEDVDLCRRLAQAFGGMRAVMVEAPPAVHEVGGSAPTTAVRRAVRAHHASSAQRFAASNQGATWDLVRAAIKPRLWWLRR